MKIKLITDSACDLDINYVKDNNIEVVPLEVHFRGKFIKDDLGQSLSFEEFCRGMREGETPSTTQVNIGTFIEVFDKYIKDGYEILYLGLASSLSGTYNSAVQAKKLIKEENKDAKIHLIDTRSASVGEGLLVYKANEMIKENKKIEDIIKYVEETKLKVNHWITVDDLNHLKRGGRISVASATIGSILNVKPIMILDNEGKIKAVDKIKGRKKVLKYLANKYIEKAVDKENQSVFISHVDSKEDAEYIKNIIITESKAKEVFINNIGSVIGSHGGPGALAIIFIAENR